MTSALELYENPGLAGTSFGSPSPIDPNGVIRVAYQGEPGAYSEQACKQLFGADGTKVEPVPCQSFSQLFATLHSGAARFILAPIENSLGGSIHENYDLTLRHKVTCVAELQFRVSHCLLALPGVRLEDIRVAYSHPQALAQCEEYLNKIGVQPEKQYDTAGSAKMIAERGLKNVAAIASELAAKTYGLEVLARAIEDEEGNFTRFLLLAPATTYTQQAALYSSPAASTPSVSASSLSSIVHPNVANLRFSSSLTRLTFKTSLAFTLPDAAGSLFKALSVFALRDLVLCKIESRPCKNLELLDAGAASATAQAESDSAEFKYLFFIDALTSLSQNEALKNGLRHLKEYAPFLRVLGSYPVFQSLGSSSASTPTAAASQSAGGELVSSVPPTVGSAYRKLRIGILGFGTFGQFLSKTFRKQGHEQFVYSRSDYSSLSKELGVNWCATIDELLESRLDILILSMSILSFESVVKEIPFERLKNCTVVDVLSVKQHPKDILSNAIETRGDKSIDLLCTHPMFGPDSGGRSWSGLAFMYDRVRIGSEDRCAAFLHCFASEGCRMLEMTCDAHDSYAAGSQFLTHTTGRILARLNCVSTPINTAGYAKLLQVIDQTQKDSWELYAGLYKFNSKSRQQLDNFARVFEELTRKLRETVTSGQTDAATSTSTQVNFNPNALRMNESKTAAVADLTKRLQAQGRSITSLSVGEVLSVPTPSSIIEAAATAMRQGRTTYTQTNGLLELRQAICNKLKRENRLDYTPDSIVVSNGAKQSIYQALQALIVPGVEDEVIIPAPYWVSYPDMTTLVGGRPVIVDTNASGYILTPLQLASAITPRTKVLILCTPSNPTGVVYTQAQLEAIAQVLRQHPRIQVISDEIYEHLLFSGAEHTSFASLAGMHSRTITVNGFSKGYVMTGFRVGYIAAPLAIAQMCTKIQGQITSCASTISQYAALEALNLPAEFRNNLVTGLDKTRVGLLQALDAIPHVTYTRPNGAFYVLVDCSKYFGSTNPKDSQIIKDSEDLAMYLLDGFNVALVPGLAFGAPNCLRISYASSDEIVQQGARALAQGLAQLKTI